MYRQCIGRTRTNIEIDDDDVASVMRRYGVRTKTEAVAIALKTAAVEPMTDEEFLAMQGAHAIGEVPPDVPPRS